MTRLALLAAVATTAIAAPSFAAMSLSQSDGLLPVAYANGGGAGFGGSVGTGTVTLDSVAGNLVVTFANAVGLAGSNNIATLYLDTRAGGFDDAAMNDTGDGGRNVITNLGSTANAVFPTGTANGLPDFAINFRGTGTELFELNGGTLAFVQSGTTGTITLPLGAIAASGTSTIDFFLTLSSPDFLSDESLPASALNAGGNPGGGGAATYDNFNRFVVPEPTTLAAVAGLGSIALRRRK